MPPLPASSASARAPSDGGERGRSPHFARCSMRATACDLLSARLQDDANANGVVVHPLRHSDDVVVVVDVMGGGDAPTGIWWQQVGKCGQYAVSPEKPGAVVRPVEAGADDPPGVVDGARIHPQCAARHIERCWL